MAMGAQCYICYLPALRSCRKCGRMVCFSHYDNASSLCVRCKNPESKPGKA